MREIAIDLLTSQSRPTYCFIGASFDTSGPEVRYYGMIGRIDEDVELSDPLNECREPQMEARSTHRL